MYLIVIEAESDLGHPGPGPEHYHYQPYRVAASLDEARELMADYLKLDPDEAGNLMVKYFALYQERGGEFGMPEYFDPADLEVVDATAWLQDTGRA